MIRFFLLQNKSGKTRLRRWYVDAVDAATQAAIEQEIHQSVVSRKKAAANVSYLAVFPCSLPLAH